MNNDKRPTIKKLNATPVLGVFTRYWILFVVLAVLAALIVSNILFSVVGAMLWVPAGVLASMGSALLARNVFNSQTSDKDADTGRFEAEWNNLDLRTRVILTVAQLLVYFLGACIIFASIASR